METTVTSLRPLMLKAAIVLGIGSFASAVAAGLIFEPHPYLSIAATIDLLVSVPIAYWFFIRNTSVPKVTTVPVFIAGVLLATAVLPESDRGLLNVIVMYGLPAIELFGLSYAGIRIFSIRRTFLKTRGSAMDTFERLRRSFAEHIYPAAVARAAAFEVGVAALLFLQWKTPRDLEKFTYHKKNGAAALLSVFMFVLSAETLVLHLLISKWSPAAAWIITVFSIYFALQIAAHLKGVILRPIVVSADRVYFRCGVLADSSIEISNIEHVEVISARSEDALSFTPIAEMSVPNIKLTLRSPAEVYGIYNLRNNVSKLEFYVDTPARLIDLLNGRISDQ
ncbi:MAG: hypothetical protein AB7V18_07620 [Pyrinomonadaceae bacterium]